MFKKCESCNEEFESKTKRSKYCGRFCAVNENVNCTRCDVGFVRQRNKNKLPYCSAKCRNINEGKLIRFSCDGCGVFSYRQKSLLERSDKNYCGTFCQHKALCDKNDYTCVSCKVEFKAIKTGSGHRKYCSQECRRVKINPKELTKYYVDEGLNAQAVGLKLGVSESLVLKRLAEANVKIRSAGFGKRYMALDGTEVKSSYEKVFSDKLHQEGLTYKYDYPLPTKRSFLTDFLVEDVFVEIWGMVGYPEYEERRKLKQKLYEKKGLKLVNIFPEDFEDIDVKIRELKSFL